MSETSRRIWMPWTLVTTVLALAIGAGVLSAETTSSPTPVLPHAFAIEISGGHIDLLPSPVGLMSSPKGISCTSRQFCEAIVDRYQNDTMGSHTIAMSAGPVFETYHHGRWSIPPQPLNTEQHLVGPSSVSCADPHFCAVVGGMRTPVIETFNGSRWSIARSNLPGSQQLGGAILLGASCTSDHFCIAAGAQREPSKLLPLVETFNGTTWTAQFGQPSLDFNGALWSVSCTFERVCAAGGSGTTSSGESRPMFVADSQGTWKPYFLPIAAGSVMSVSCTTGGCMGLGDTHVAGRLYGYVACLKRVNGRWRTSVNIKPLDDVSTRGPNLLASIACPRPGRCVVVGGTGSTSNPTPFVASMSGSSWRDETDELPGDLGKSVLHSVSCSSVHTCIAVGVTESP